MPMVTYTSWYAQFCMSQDPRDGSSNGPLPVSMTPFGSDGMNTPRSLCRYRIRNANNSFLRVHQYFSLPLTPIYSYTITIRRSNRRSCRRFRSSAHQMTDENHDSNNGNPMF